MFKYKNDNRKQKPVSTLEINGLSELIKQVEKLDYCLEKTKEAMINFGIESQ